MFVVGGESLIDLKEKPSRMTTVTSTARGGGDEEGTRSARRMATVTSTARGAGSEEGTRLVGRMTAVTSTARGGGEEEGTRLGRRMTTVTLTAHAGGSPMNCAIALRRMGHDTGFLCPISQDRFGGMILAPLAEAGVKVLLRKRVREPTSLAVVSDDGRGNPRYQFYRHADRAFSREELIAALPRKVELFQFGGFCPIEAYDARAWLETAKVAAAAGATISIDPNVRPALIRDMAAYKQRLGRMLDLAHIVKVSHEDLDYLEKSKPLEAHAGALLARPNCRLVIITRATDGSVAFTRDATATSPIYPAKKGGDNVGAGDTLMAGVLSWLRDHRALAPQKLAALSGDQLHAMLWFGAVAAGINCSRIGANPPTRAEIDAIVARAK